MPDVFISYARSTETQAQPIEAALRALGYVVWRDDQLPTHRRYLEVLEERLRAAKAVVVIWSAEAVKSDWVRAEADAARQAGTLVQLSIDGAAPPMPFNQIHCAELKGWSGDTGSPAWRTVVDSVAELAGDARAPAPRTPSAAASDATAQPLLAVLAFDNLSGDDELLYFSDGVSEEILQTVSRTTKLKVIGRGSSFQFRGPDKAAAKVAQALKATHVLDGSVRRSGKRVRIAASLIECQGETTIWSDRFESELSDIFALQDDIAAAVAAALNVVFASRVAAGAIDPSAHDLYLRATAIGTGHLIDDAGRQEIIGLLEEATRLAPRFAMAWAFLAGVRVAGLRYGEPGQPYAAARAKVVEAAQAALDIDPGLGIAYQPIAALEAFNRYAERETLFDRALAASPNDPQVLTVAGFFSAEVGRIHEAASRARQAFDLDPMQFSAAYAYATFLDFEGRYEETKGLWDRFCARWPDSEMMIDASIATALHNRDWDRFETLMASETAAPDPLQRRRAMAWLGRNLRAPDPQAIGRLLERSRRDLEAAGTLRLDLLVSLYNLGLADETFELIDQTSFAYMSDPEQRWPSGTLHGGYIFNVSANHRMMADARFPRLCAKLGLCDYWAKTDRWPDCADEGVLPYDFKIECRRLAAARRAPLQGPA